MKLLTDIWFKFRQTIQTSKSNYWKIQWMCTVGYMLSRCIG